MFKKVLLVIICAAIFYGCAQQEAVPLKKTASQPTQGIYEPFATDSLTPYPVDNDEAYYPLYYYNN